MTMIHFMLAFIVFFIIAGIVICIKVSSSSYKISKKKQVLQNPETWYKLPLSKIIEITHDTKIFRFEFSNPDAVLGLTVGSHVVLRATFPTHDHPNGETVERKYTPVSSVNQKCYVDLLIKIYKPEEKFPNGGKMSQYIDSLKVGDQIEFKGPLYRFEYLGQGDVQVSSGKGWRKLKISKLAMIGGGTGITPLYQVIKYIESVQDQVQISLLYANRSPDDILLLDELKNLAQNKVITQYLLVDDTKGKPWNQGVGFITKEVLQNNFPKPAEDVMVLLCGPPPMTFNMKKYLLEMNYSEQNIFIF